MAIGAKEVKIIKPTKALQNEKKIRVAAYCRVSTDSEDQLNSFFAQMKYYTDYIRNNDQMVLVDIYADEGITGTSIQKREEFKRLIKDCKNKKIDRVIVKSVTRFARNSLECIETVRELKSHGGSVFFENDNMDTDKMNSEMILYIKGAFAQSEALSASRRMQTSIRMKMESGTYTPCKAPFGYRLVDGELVVEPSEAKMVVQIYQLYLKGYGDTSIAKYLSSVDPDHYWDEHHISYILTNERYIGDSLWQKSYTPQELPFSNKKNHGRLPKYYCEGTQEAIISKEVFEEAQALRKEKKQRYYKGTSLPKLFLDGHIKCRHCGWKFKSKECSDGIRWVCSCKSRHVDDCPARIYSDREVSEAFISVYNTLKQNEKLLLDETISSLQMLKSRINSENNAVSEIDEKLAELSSRNNTYANLFSNGIINELVYYEKADQIKNEITELRSKRFKLINEDEDELCIEELRKLKRIIDNAEPRMALLDQIVFSKIVRKIYAEPDGALTFSLLGGLELKKYIGEAV